MGDGLSLSSDGGEEKNHSKWNRGMGKQGRPKEQEKEIKGT